MNLSVKVFSMPPAGQRPCRWSVPGRRAIAGALSHLLMTGFLLASTLTWSATAREADRVFQQGMSEAAIRAELIDVPLEGQYVDERPWAETYFKDGRIEYKDPQANWTGQWSFRGAGFCTFYNEGSSGGCWRVIKSSSNCYYFYGLQRSGEPFRGVPGKSQGWTARGWRKSKPSTCDVAVGV